MARGRAAKTVTFLIELDLPSDEVMLMTHCPMCEVPLGSGCVSYTGKSRGFHHERFAVALNLEPSRNRTAYRIK